MAICSGLVVIARLLNSTSECAWLPFCCRLMRRNDSNGIWSAMPCELRVDVRRGFEAGAGAGAAACVCGVTK